MNKKTQKYVDLCLIDEYADKDFTYGYSLDVTSLPTHEQENFLDFLFENDEVMKEIVLDRMQELIEQRIPWVESQDKYDAGFKPIVDQNNGEVSWIRRGAA